MLKYKNTGLVHAQMYRPNFMAVVFNPYFIARRSLYLAVKANSSLLEGRILDVGCGSKPYLTLFDKAEVYIGLDIDNDENRLKGYADVFYDGSRFPFDDNSFDSIVLNQVFEHVFNPIDFFIEVKRVLKPGGFCLITVPFVWDEHEQPYDYARYSSYGLRYIAEINDFEVFYEKKLCSDLRVLFQLTSGYIYKVTRSLPLILRLLVQLFLIFPINLLGSFLYLIFPSNSDLFLDNLFILKRK